MRLLATQVGFWREAWQLEQVSPFLNALGWKVSLFMSREADEKSGLNSPNLLDHLVTKALERRFAQVNASPSKSSPNRRSVITSRAGRD